MCRPKRKRAKRFFLPLHTPITASARSLRHGTEPRLKLLGDGVDLPRVRRVIRPAAIPTAGDQTRIAEDLHMMRQRRLRDAQIRQPLAGTLLPLPQGSQDTETIVIRKRFRDFDEIMLLFLHTAALLLERTDSSGTSFRKR